MIELRDERILVTGGGGFIGGELLRNLAENRGVPKGQIQAPRARDADLRIYAEAERVIREARPTVIIHLASLVGGVGYSSAHGATQLYANALMDLQVLEASKDAGIKKVVLVGSSCAYPERAPYPLRETSLWDGLPQETNLPYGVAKRLMTVAGPAYRKEFGLNAVTVMPNNAYGPGDNFHPEHSHVIPSLIRRCLLGEDPLVVWGDGSATRDFLYVSDFAEGVLLAAERLESDDPVNLGSGTETAVRDLVSFVREATGHQGRVRFDPSKPGGQPRRSVDVSRAKELLGFAASVPLAEGIARTVAWYRENRDGIAARHG